MSTRTGIQGIVLFAALAVGLAWWFGDSSPLPSTATVPAQGAVHAVGGAVDVPAPRREVFAAAEGTGAGRTLTIRVQLEDGSPAVGAMVRVGPRQDTNQIVLRHDDDDSTWPSYRADADATVAVPWPRTEIGEVPISARHGAAWGRIELGASTSPGSAHTIRVERDRTLVVRTVDANMRPVPDVPIELLAPPRALRAETMSAIAHAISTADGLAVFPHAQRWIAAIDARDGVLPVRVTTGGLVQATPIELDAARLPSEPVILTLDPFGCVEVHAFQADGTPVPEGEAVSVSHGQRVWVQRAVAGVARFLVAPLGATGTAWVIGGTGTEFQAPSVPGGRVIVEVRADASVWLTATIVRNRAPAAAMRFWLADKWLAKQVLVTSDANGRVRAPLRLIGSGETTVRFDALDAADEPTGLRAEWTGTLSGTGDHDMGTLALHEAAELPVIAAGRIVGTTDLDQVTLDVSTRWQRRSVPVTVRIGTDGAFEVRSSVTREGLQLTASAPHHVGDAVPFRCGQRGLVLELQPEHRVCARIVVGSRAAAMTLQPELFFAPDDEDDDPLSLAPDRRSYDGEVLTCEWWHLGAEYDLRIRGYVQGPELKRIRDVASDGRDDPRLARIELSLPRLLRVTLPEPIEGDTGLQRAEVEMLRGGESIGQAVRLDERTWSLLVNEPVDLRVRVPGYRERILRGVSGDVVVALDPGIDVVLECPADDLAGLRWTTVEVIGPAWGQFSFVDTTARLALPAPGIYDLRGNAHTGEGHIDLEFDPPQIEVGDAGGRFTVRVSRE